MSESRLKTKPKKPTDIEISSGKNFFGHVLIGVIWVIFVCYILSLTL